MFIIDGFLIIFRSSDRRSVFGSILPRSWLFFNHDSMIHDYCSPRMIWFKSCSDWDLIQFTMNQISSNFFIELFAVTFTFHHHQDRWEDLTEEQIEENSEREKAKPGFESGGEEKRIKMMSPFQVQHHPIASTSHEMYEMQDGYVSVLPTVHHQQPTQILYPVATAMTTTPSPMMVRTVGPEHQIISAYPSPASYSTVAVGYPPPNAHQFQQQQPTPIIVYDTNAMSFEDRVIKMNYIRKVLVVLFTQIGICFLVVNIFNTRSVSTSSGYITHASRPCGRNTGLQTPLSLHR